MQAGVKDLEADMSNVAEDPTTTFCLKGRGTRFTGEELWSSRTLTTTFTSHALK
jgi:hypothetical protein